MPAAVASQRLPPTASTSSAKLRGSAVAFRSACSARVELPLVEALLPGAREPFEARVAERAVVDRMLACAEQVECAAEEAPAHDRAPLERARELLAAEALDPRPEVDVRRLDALRVQRADALERARDRQAGALEQELPREQRAVQLAHGQHTLAVTAGRRLSGSRREGRRAARRRRRGRPRA